VIRHLATSADPRTSACGTIWWDQSAAHDTRAADSLQDVSCKLCRCTDAYGRLVAVLAGSLVRAGVLLAAQQNEIRLLRAALRDAAEMHEARGLAKTSGGDVAEAGAA